MFYILKMILHMCQLIHTKILFSKYNKNWAYFSLSVHQTKKLKDYVIPFHAAKTGWKSFVLGFLNNLGNGKEEITRCNLLIIIFEKQWFQFLD